MPSLRTKTERDVLRNRARIMKYNGDSISVIRDALGVPYGTIGDWVRGIEPEPAMLKHCAVCDDPFLAVRRDQKRCPDHRRKPDTDSTFVRGWCALKGCDNRVPPPRKVYCSEEHLRRATRIAAAERKRLKKGDSRTFCLYCGTQFVRSRSDVRYCSKAHRRLAELDKRRMQNGCFEERECLYCGKPFLPARRKSKFCSRAHMARWKRANRKNAVASHA